MILWKHFLRLCFTPPYTVSKRLLQPLGPWFTQDFDSWDWWFSHSTDLLFNSIHLGWSQWYRNASPYQPHRFRCSPESLLVLPPDSIQVTVCHAPRHLHAVILHFSPIPLPTAAIGGPPIVPFPNLRSILDALPPSQQWAFDFVDLPANLPSIITAI